MTLERSSTPDVISWGREKARTSRWQGEEGVVLITPVPEGPLLSSDFVRHCLDRLSDHGFNRVITGALSPLEQAGFLAAGFEVEERLRLLSLDLQAPLPEQEPGLPLRRVPRRRWPELLAVDQAAFDRFWCFDQNGLEGALAATPQVRLRAALAPGGSMAGYAICGRSGSRGFVQRLAVDPEEQRRGAGRRLLLDGLHWLRRRAVKKAVVNTQDSNGAALALYQDIGFREEPVGLSVLSTGLA